MESKRGSLSTVFLVIAIILIMVMTAFMYMQKTEADRQIAELKNNANEMKETIDELQGKIDSISNTNDISFLVISVENKNASEIASKFKIITDTKEIESLMKIIDSATIYDEKSLIPDFGDVPPTVEVYESNGKKYTIAAGDQINDDGNVVNLMTKWDSQDGSDKTLYKVDVKLAEYIENLYNTIKFSTLTSEKEIYMRVSAQDMNSSELEYYNEPFIVLENDTIYFSTNLSDKILEGTYIVNSNNTIEYKILKETQDYAFYTSSIFKFEDINGIKNIVVDNNPNGTMYFQKVD